MGRAFSAVLFFARVSSSLASIAAAFRAAFASIAFRFRAAGPCPGELLPSRFGRRGLVLANCYRRVLGAWALSWRIVGVQFRAVAAGFALARTCRAAFARISRGDFHLAQFGQL